MFKYFCGPQQEMRALVDGDTKCFLCGRHDSCFKLEFARCPELSAEQKELAHGCFSCLHDGRFEFWHDTEIGMLDENGLRHLYNHNRPAPPDFPATALLELRRTPQLVTWQQEIWLVHCMDFMAYIGTWEPKDFYANAHNGDGKALFYEMTSKDEQHLWDASLPQDATRLETWHATYYAFRCLHCDKRRGNWDCN